MKNIKIIHLILFTGWLFYSCSGSVEKTEVLNSTSFYPEGPMLMDGNLFYVEYSKDRIMKYNAQNKSNVVFFHKKGCGPASLINYRKNLVVSCYDSSSLIFLDRNAILLKEIDSDSKGKNLNGPNDFAIHPSGTLFFSSSGVFDVNALSSGSIYYLEDGMPILLIKNLHYPNGIAFSVDGKKIYINEHLSGKITSFNLNEKITEEKKKVWSLYGKELFYQFKEYQSGDYTGPDGLKADTKGNLWVALYGAGKIVRLNTEKDAENRRMLEISFDEKFITNLFLNAKEKTLFVTASEDAFKAPYPGKILKLYLKKSSFE